ncbi:hypothetical protein [Frankia sp. AgB32]|uniref:hypothetical protein n=1 Tax=Frankia sp. AgB32 TaxID=631119 RepID=UPI00200FAD8A|nr:hypothetical protein [Frankia sp. AgB32]MCK9897907.1 hypothetical protein [Frankia sp. AgB32]
MPLMRMVAAAVWAAVVVPLAGCGGDGGDGVESGTGDADQVMISTPTGAPAATADAATACAVIVSSGRHLPTSGADLDDHTAYPESLFARVQGAVGLAAAATQRDPRFSPVSRAANTLGKDLQHLRVEDFPAAVSATADACQALGLPVAGPDPSARGDAATGCAAAARARDRIEVASFRSFEAADVSHFDGIAMFLRAAAEADSRYAALGQAGQRLGGDVSRFDTRALRADGSALLAACGADDLPH